MKALIISDVHGNIDALRTVVETEKDADGANYAVIEDGQLR